MVLPHWMIFLSDCILFLLVGISLPEIPLACVGVPQLLVKSCCRQCFFRTMANRIHTHWWDRGGGRTPRTPHSCWPHISIAHCGLGFPLGMGGGG